MNEVSNALSKATKRGTMAGLKTGQIKTVLSGYKADIANALPKHLTADRVIQMAATLIHRNPKIAGCKAESLVGAVMQASILGFKPVESLGYCYFVPYGNELRFQIGYKGYIDLARRSGQIKMIYAQVVRENDEFDYAFGLEPKLEHKPAGDDSVTTHAYAVAHYKDGGYNFVVLTKKQIEKLRMASPMQEATPSGPWKEWYDKMAMAKAIKQLAPYMPLSEEAEEAVLTDERVVTPESFEAGKVKIEQLEDPDYESYQEAEEDKEKKPPQTQQTTQNNNEAEEKVKRAMKAQQKEYEPPKQKRKTNDASGTTSRPVNKPKPSNQNLL